VQGQPTDFQCGSIMGIKVKWQPTDSQRGNIIGIRVQGQPSDFQGVAASRELECRCRGSLQIYSVWQHHGN
jgi:hypothetical protein